MLRLASIAITICFGLVVTSVAQSRADVCHVYIVDSALADRYKEASAEELQRVAKSIVTQFSEFRPNIGEEELTTKTYRFPGSKLIITASVFYTDESLRSEESADSIIVALVVSSKRLEHAMQEGNNAVAEVTYTGKPITVRTRKFLRVNKRWYAVGLECHCQEKTESK